MICLIKFDFSVGPYEDGMFYYISCIFYECNLKSILFFLFLWFTSSIFKFVKTFNEIIFLPFKFGIIFDSSNIINKVIFFKFNIFKQIYEYNFFYSALLFVVVIKYILQKNFYILNLVLIFIYIIFIYTLQNQIRHFFYLEGISLIIMILLSIEFYKNLQKLRKYVKKK